MTETPLHKFNTTLGLIAIAAGMGLLLVSAIRETALMFMAITGLHP